MTHTPGPWKVAYYDKNEQAVVKATNAQEIATCWHHCVRPLEIEMKANARLIAAAPDLLAMLKTVTAELEAEVNDTYSYCTDGNDEMHPALVRRYERDMSSVRNAQALIAAIEGAEVTI